MTLKKQNGLQHLRFIWPARCRRTIYVRHESNERGTSKSCRRPPAQYFVGYDPQPVHRTPHRICNHSPYPELLGLDGDGGKLCECRPDEPRTIDGRDYGSECGNDLHRMDNRPVRLQGEYFGIRASPYRHRCRTSVYE